MELQFSNDYHTLQLISTVGGKMRMLLKHRTQIRGAIIYALFRFVAIWCRQVTHYPTCLSFTFVKEELIKCISPAEVLCRFNVMKIISCWPLKSSSRRHYINRIIPPWNMREAMNCAVSGRVVEQQLYLLNVALTVLQTFTKPSSAKHYQHGTCCWIKPFWSPDQKLKTTVIWL